MHSYSRLGLVATVAGCIAVNASTVFCQAPPSSTAQAPANETAPAQILPNDDRIQLIGRVDDRNPLKPRLAYPGTEIRLRVRGGSLRLIVSSDSDKSALTIVVDHGAPRLQLLHAGSNDVTLAAVPAEGDHTFEMVKRTETWQGILTVESIRLRHSGVPEESRAPISGCRGATP